MTTQESEKPRLVIENGKQTSFTYQAKKFWGNDFVQINTDSLRDFDSFTERWRIGELNGESTSPKSHPGNSTPGRTQYKWCEKHRRRYDARYNQCYLCSQEQGLLNTANEH